MIKTIEFGQGKKIIQEIQQRYQINRPLNTGDLIRENDALYVASRTYFGSWRNAIIAAGIDYDAVMKRKSWANESIIATIKKLYKKGIDLSTKNMKKEYRPLYMAAGTKYHFGSWRAAVLAAGIDYDSYLNRQFWTKESILKKIIEIYDLGEDLSAGSVQKKYNSLATAAPHDRYFGSWKNAIEAAGLDYSKVTEHIFWTKMLIIQRIMEMNDSGEDLSESSIQANHPPLFME